MRPHCPVPPRRQPLPHAGPHSSSGGSSSTTITLDRSLFHLPQPLPCLALRMHGVLARPPQLDSPRPAHALTMPAQALQGSASGYHPVCSWQPPPGTHTPTLLTRHRRCGSVCVVRRRCRCRTPLAACSRCPGAAPPCVCVCVAVGGWV